MLSFVLSVPLLVEISFSRKDAKSAKGKSIAVLSSWRSLRLGASRFWLRPDFGELSRAEAALDDSCHLWLRIRSPEQTRPKPAVWREFVASWPPAW